MLTRLAHEDAPLASALEQLGVDVLHHPLDIIEPIPEPALPDVNGFAVADPTSARLVGSRLPSHIPVAAMDDATARALREAGARVDRIAYPDLELAAVPNPGVLVGRSRRLAEAVADLRLRSWAVLGEGPFVKRPWGVAFWRIDCACQLVEVWRRGSATEPITAVPEVLVLTERNVQAVLSSATLTAVPVVVTRTLRTGLGAELLGMRWTAAVRHVDAGTASEILGEVCALLGLPTPGPERNEPRPQPQPGPAPVDPAQEQRRAIEQALATFEATLTDAPEQAIWTRRLYSQQPDSLTDLAASLGIAKERVRQLEAQIKRRLSAHLDQALRAR